MFHYIFVPIYYGQRKKGTGKLFFVVHKSASSFSLYVWFLYFNNDDVPRSVKNMIQSYKQTHRPSTNLEDSWAGLVFFQKMLYFGKNIHV
jgi:hypothetical protein